MASVGAKVPPVVELSAKYPLLLVSKLNTIFGTSYATENELRKYMKNNKTECALKIFDTQEEIVFPDYIMEAIK